ncbi:MAG: gamma-glutamyl-gamma-aminobutyrate hydrolase family protein [Acetatifactor sp.]
MKIAIAGKKTETKNYVNYVKSIGAEPVVTLSMGDIVHCGGLILPGGGDITPAFFGEKNHGSRNINTELDILQLQALDLCVRESIPVLGICKGLQIINVGFGGSLVQDLPTASHHRYEGGDQYHASVTLEASVLRRLYGERPIINSAHHQAVNELGRGLEAVQWCPDDNCIEAIMHTRLPILGVQWHPERIDEKRAMISGRELLTYFASLIPSCRQ